MYSLYKFKRCFLKVFESRMFLCFFSSRVGRPYEYVSDLIFVVLLSKLM